MTTKYSCVSGDVVCQGIPILRSIGLGMIGNNPTTVDGKGISFLQAHSEGNQNINNLRFVFDKNNKEKLDKYNKTIEIFNKVYGDENNRKIQVIK